MAGSWMGRIADATDASQGVVECPPGPGAGDPLGFGRAPLRGGKGRIPG